MKRQATITSLLLLLLLLLFVIQLSSCSNEISPIMYDDYLDISEYNFDKMSDSDLQIMQQAELRIGVYFIDGLYQFREKDCKAINISEGLYDLIVGGYSRTNELFTGKNKRFPRTKSRQETVTNNCVPIAISFMGVDAPSYDDAVEACNQHDPGWDSRGGVASNKVGEIINEFTSVTQENGFSQYSSSTNLQSCVLLIYQNSTYDHAVNALTYYPNTHSIRYQDKSSSSPYDNRLISSDQVSAYFPFK